MKKITIEEFKEMMKELGVQDLELTRDGLIEIAEQIDKVLLISAKVDFGMNIKEEVITKELTKMLIMISQLSDLTSN